MLGEPFFFVALVPTLLELIVIALRPTWFAPFAMWKVSEHTFTLRNPRRDAREANYRDAAMTTQAALPSLPPRTEMSDAVLTFHDGKLALRRAFFGGRGRNMWLVPITVAREGDTIRLVATQVFLPLTVVLTAPLMSYAITHNASDWVALLGISALLIGGFAVQFVFSLPGRNVALRESYSFIERELRLALEEAQAGHPTQATW